MADYSRSSVHVRGIVSFRSCAPICPLANSLLEVAITINGMGLGCYSAHLRCIFDYEFDDMESITSSRKDNRITTNIRYICVYVCNICVCVCIMKKKDFYERMSKNLAKVYYNLWRKHENSSVTLTWKTNNWQWVELVSRFGVKRDHTHTHAHIYIHMYIKKGKRAKKRKRTKREKPTKKKRENVSLIQREKRRLTIRDRVSLCYEGEHCLPGPFKRHLNRDS